MSYDKCLYCIYLYILEPDGSVREALVMIYVLVLAASQLQRLTLRIWLV